MTDATLALGALIGAPTAPAATGAATPTAGADFLALVQELLGRSGGGSSTESAPTTVPDAPPVPVGGELSTVSVPGTVPDAPLAPVGGTTTDGDETDGDDTETTVDATPASVPAPPLLPSPLLPSPVLPPALLQAAVTAAAAPGPAVAEPTPRTPSATGTAAPPSPATAPTGDHHQPDQQPVLTPVVAQPAPTAQTAQTTPATLATPVAPAAPIAPTATPATPPAPAARVTHQVFPEVVRVAGLGNGPQRVTVRLQPENLGEVRVVLTSRRGELQVSLAASGEAHRALVEGTPELRRLLEAVGSTDARVVVRDLPGGTATPVTPVTPTPTGTGTGTDVRGDLAGGAGAGSRQAAHPGSQQDGRSGQSPPRGSTTAMDGTPDATSPLRRSESVTRARAGLDVTV